MNFKHTQTHNENKILQVFTPDTFLGGKINFLLQKLVHVGGELILSCIHQSFKLLLCNLKCQIIKKTKKK